LKKLVCLVLCAVLLCGLVSAYSSGGSMPTIKVYNWGDYIDEAVLDMFEEEYGIKVIYDTFDTNESMYNNIVSKGSAAGYDIVIPSDYMISKMINEGLLAKIDTAALENYDLIDDKFKNLECDPNNEYSVPYMWGTVGIAYNTALMDEVPNSWAYLWDEDYAGQIYMLNSQRDSIAVALKYLGYSINTRDEKELAEAEAALVAQKELVQAYVGDEVKDQMIAGSAAMAVMWAGDAQYCMQENPDLNFVIPKEGTNYFFDAMVIPSTCQNKEAAELFINYMCETQVAFDNVDYIDYSTPHTGAMALMDEELINDRRFYPQEEDLQNSEIFVDMADALPMYDAIWTRITAN